MERGAKGGGLVEAVQILTSEFADYVEARLRLFRAELRGALDKAGCGVAFCMEALISLVVAYFLGLGLIVALLARLFGGHALWPLLMVSVAHLLVAALLALMSLRGWNAGEPNGEGLQPSSIYAAESTSSWTNPEISTN